MATKALRVISLVVLLAVISMVTGLGTKFSAAHVLKIEKSSCKGDGKQNDKGDQCPEDEGQCPTPCDSAFCPIFTCMVADFPSTIELITAPLQKVSFFGFIPAHIPTPFITSIFHPPSLA
ncbi:hypothetical protein KI811_16005 [Geobacter hydrogenophilus]|uniref:hypothetical protein n=1 Tax=Geobacter hydrogenophilus TaxID=40983 RepID=UPI001BDA5341|nr:hypothetical protein [Geobacter hydrogenophilus]MBT0895312.1 hypothetical protein [Geobacter hydrogenophilus]